MLIYSFSIYSQMPSLSKFGFDFFRGRNYYGQAAAIGSLIFLGLVHSNELHYRIETQASHFSARRWVSYCKDPFFLICKNLCCLLF